MQPAGSSDDGDARTAIEYVDQSRIDVVTAAGREASLTEAEVIALVLVILHRAQKDVISWQCTQGL
jgi:hypothetical protein